MLQELYELPTCVELGYQSSFIHPGAAFTLLKMRHEVPRFPIVRGVFLRWNPDADMVDIYLSDAEEEPAYETDLILYSIDRTRDPIEMARWLRRIANGKQILYDDVESSDDEA